MERKRNKFSAFLLLLLIAVVSFACFACKDDKKPQVQDGPEIGVYYFDSGADEYTVSLNSGNKFAFIYKGESKGGSYTLNGEALTFDFDKDDDGTLAATLASDALVMEYDGATMRFLKKINYTVSFDSKLGSEVSAQTVVNGKTALKPVDPARDGYLFVGWYLDEAFSQPYNFGSSISANVTLYAQWTEETATEYNVDFDLGFNGDAIAPVKTIGGKLFNAPVPTREGYEFKGWYVSMYEEASMLSYKYTADTVFNADTTLFATWQSTGSTTVLPAPALTVEAGAVKWDAVPGAGSYYIEIIGSDDEIVLSKTTTSTIENVPFANYDAGDYQIKVIAYATSGNANNSESVRYYKNKALQRVSQFSVVEPSVLVFNESQGAEKYLVSVVCGNENHNHTNFDNGTSRSFNFANCEMKEGGIEFTVTAVANGYASTTSEVFKYERKLAPVSGYSLNAATQILSWNAVAQATGYMVSVDCDNAAHNHNYVDNGSKTSVDLKECAGDVVINVYPKANGYNSPASTSYTYAKNVLATPGLVNVTGTVVSWAAVTGASSYDVQINGQIYNVTNATELDIASKVDLVEESVYSIAVRAKGATESAYSDAIVASYNAMGAVNYAGSVVSWSPVIGADGYEVQVNDGAIVAVEAGLNSSYVKLNKAGNNEVKVRFINGASRSDWAKTTVYAHRVTFDSLGGNLVDVQYVAIGDVIDAPNPSKYGYDFEDWYTTPQGPSSNGQAYRDVIFNEAGELVLYAHYAPKSVNVIYNYGLDGSGDETGATVKYDKAFTLAVPECNDGTGAFAGWYSAPYGNGVQYTDEKGNSLVSWDKLEETELYAFYVDQVLSYTLTKVNGKDAYSVFAGARFSYLSEITIPATYNGLPVAMIAGSAFANKTSLVTINIPNTVEYVSTVDPFEGCTNLEAINVYEVEGNTSVRYWSENGVLFDYGTFSTSAGATAKLAYMPLAKTGTYRIPYGVEEIPSRAFANSKISKVVIPTTVSVIGVEAFANCENLTSIVFEADATNVPLTIEARAFSGCTALEKILLPQRLQSIGTAKSNVSASGSSALASVDMTFVSNAFIGCTALAEINVSSNNAIYKSIDGVLFSKNGTELLYAPVKLAGEYTVPAGVRTIADGAFSGCSDVTNVVIPSTVTMVGECAFYNSGIQSVTFKGNGFNDVTIGKYAFRGCGNLTTVEFEAGNRIKTIKEGAFANSGIEAIEIPAFVTNIEKQAFYQCANLGEVSFAANGANLEFGTDVFYECIALETVTLPANVTAIPGVFSGCSSLQAVNVTDDNPYFESIDGVLFNEEVTEILFFPQGNSGEAGVYTLPITVKRIGNGVFRDNSGLTRIIIPNTIEYIGADAFRDTSALETVEFTGTEFAEALEIGDSAFSGSSIDEIVLPQHTTTLGASAFRGTKPTTITLNEGLETIGDNAFNSAYLYYANFAVPSTVKYIGNFAFNAADLYTFFTITDTTEHPSQLVEIGEGAFMGNNLLPAFTIPASVQKIGANAFISCMQLTTINFAQDGNLKVIGAHAFEGTRINNVIIPASVTSIEAYAFSQNQNWSAVTFSFAEGGTEDLVIGAPSTAVYNHWGEPVSTVEYGYAFANNNYATITALPDRTTVIEDYSFYYFGGYGGDGITLNFGEDARLERIGANAFHYAGIKSIVIPKTVKNSAPDENGRNLLGIGEKAFYGAYKTLASVTFQTGGTDALTIGASAFQNCDLLQTITLPARLAPYTTANGDVIQPLENGAYVFWESYKIENVFVEDAPNSYYVDIDGVLYTADLTELVFCPNAKTGTVTVPSSVTKVHDYAFAANHTSESAKVEAIVFEGGTQPLTIGTRAFAYCSEISALEIPANTSSIGAEAFYNCVSLTSLTLPSELSQFDMGLVSGCPLTEINIADGEYFTTQDGVLFNADRTKLIAYPVSAAATTYTVPNGVKTIEAKAFSNNKAISEIVLPEGLVEINANAFAGCSALTKINVPSTVELIGADAFNGCTALDDLTIADGDALLVIEDKAFYRTLALKTLELPARVCGLGEQAFYNSGIQTLEFASGIGITEIGYMTFNNSSLTSIEIPASVRYIADNAFYYCQSLMTVTMEEGLVEMGSNVFAGCSALESVEFPSTLRTMGVNTFFADDYGDPIACANLKKVTFGENSQLEAIPTGTFAYTGIESIVIPASVTTIADQLDDEEEPGAFSNCKNLKEVIFEGGSQLGYIGSYAFYKTGIESFEIPSLVASIGEYAFADSAALEAIAIPSTVTQLGGCIFQNCVSLADVELDAKVSELPFNMFAFCTSLKTIRIPDTVTAIRSSFEGAGLEEYVVDKDNTAFAAIDGVLYDAGCTQIISYPAGKKSTTFEVPNTVTTIADETFYANKTLTAVTFESGGEEDLTIGEYSFSEMSNLTSIILPERLVSIGEYAFADNAVLEEVTLPSTLTEIPYRAFSYCSSLKTINFAEGLEYIDSYAFYECESITELNLPDSVDEIADSAFYYCDNVYKITLPASLTEINDYMFGYYGCPALEVYNRSDIELTLDNAKSYKFNAVINIYTPTEGASIFFEQGDWRYIKVTERSVTKNYLFKYLGNETEITLPVADGMYSQFLSGSAVTKVTVPSGYTEISDGAFANSSVTTVVLPDTVTSIGDQAFYNLKTLTDVNLENVTSIGKEAFYYCSNLTSVDISSMETLGEWAFYYAGLTSIEIPETLTTIGDRAFMYTKIAEVVIPTTVTTIGDRAFYYLNNNNVVLFIKVSEKPEGWNSNWNGGSGTVLWGYTGVEVTYSFVTNVDGVTIDDIVDDGTITLPTITLPDGPTDEHYYFAGWYTDSAFENAASSPYYNGTLTTLYAKWLTKEEYIASFAGTSPSYAIDYTVGEDLVMNYDTDGKTYWYKFTTSVAGTYTIVIEGNESMDITDAVYLYQDPQSSYKTYLYSGSKTATLEANTVYYLKIVGYYYYPGVNTIRVTAPAA